MNTENFNVYIYKWNSDPFFYINGTRKDRREMIFFNQK